MDFTLDPSVFSQHERLGLLLACEGLGDCLFGLAVIRKLKRTFDCRFDVFTLHPELFRACPYVERAYPLEQVAVDAYGHKFVRMFEPDKLPHRNMDTFDFISIPLGLGQLSFAEKQLEYFPVEEDQAQAFDVVLNTSMTWRTRSWPLEHWQRLADALTAKGHSVAVVGKDVESRVEQMVKQAPPLNGQVTNFVNRLSLDQTYHTIRKAGLFVTGQGGLSVLAGATDTEIIVLGSAIEWSKRAIYRHADPFYKATYATGDCEVHCGRIHDCAVPQNNFRCVPGYDAVAAAVFRKLRLNP